MDNSHRRRRTSWLPAMLTSLLLALGSFALAAPASADPSPHDVSAPGHAHQPATKSHPSHASTTSRSSAVSLPRPNGFQAQADPDGMTNGGVDQPGGQGGVDTTSQDGNNGSGNDTDCEDDNRGVGVPGHCKDRTHEPTPGSPGLPGTENPGTDTPVTTTTEQVLAPVPSTFGVPSQQPQAPAVESATVAAPAGVTSEVRAAAAPTTGVLPETGAGPALLALAIAGVLALALGGGLLRRGQRTAA